MNQDHEMIALALRLGSVFEAITDRELKARLIEQLRKRDGSVPRLSVIANVHDALGEILDAVGAQ